jgi:antitoxin PrlF
MSDQPRVSGSSEWNEEEEDPTVIRFLELLEADIVKNPHRLTGLPVELYRRFLEVTDGLDFDLDEPIEGDVAI